MAEIKLPYGQKELLLRIPDDRLEAVLVPGIHQYQVENSQEEIIRRALENPIGTPRLKEMVRDREKVEEINKFVL
ncbi:MAG: lactate racemase [Halanaerobiales bacterium]|nr:lactate racemase [Halanaerobiales bacterium]